MMLYSTKCAMSAYLATNVYQIIIFESIYKLNQKRQSNLFLRASRLYAITLEYGYGDMR